MSVSALRSYVLEDGDVELMQGLRNDGFHLDAIAEKFECSSHTVRHQTKTPPLPDGSFTIAGFVMAYAKNELTEAEPITHNRALLGFSVPADNISGPMKTMMYSELRGHAKDLLEMKDGERLLITKAGEPFCVFVRMCWSYYCEKGTGLTQG